MRQDAGEVRTRERRSAVADTDASVKQAVPFLLVSDMEASLRFYVEGLGFEMTEKWIFDGTVRWCWLRRGGASLMLQDFRHEDGKTHVPADKLGVGVSIVFVCADALAIYREVTGRGLRAGRPFVGNGMWVTSLEDPNGYHIDFESCTHVPEETEYSEDLHGVR